VKWLVDAQLPRRVVYLLREHGYDALHALDLAMENRTPDAVILLLADCEERVIVTKDADFVDTFFFQRQPRKLPLISTGNIYNSRLLDLLRENLAALVAAFQHYDFVELTVDSLIVRA
jgi:predicted nuclease of predicted toxin-antitoxin system